MHKVSVGRAISGAYELAFAGFLTVLGTVWLPFLVLGALCAGSAYLIAPDLVHQLQQGQIDETAVSTYRRVQGIWTIGGWVISAMVTVGLQERALGRVKGPTFVYFSLGMPVWRMLGAMFLCFVALFFLAIVTAAAAAIVAFLSIQFVPKFGLAIAVTAAIVAAGWFIYAMLRLTFLLPAVVVEEGHIGLPRSWELGGGNFWRIIIVVLAAFIPVSIGLGMVWSAVMGPLVPTDLISQIHPHMGEAEINRFVTTFVNRMLREFRSALPFLAVFAIVQQLLYLGLWNGAIAKAYLSAAGKEP